MTLSFGGASECAAAEPAAAAAAEPAATAAIPNAAAADAAAVTSPGARCELPREPRHHPWTSLSCLRTRQGTVYRCALRHLPYSVTGAHTARSTSHLIVYL